MIDNCFLLSSSFSCIYDCTAVVWLCICGSTYTMMAASVCAKVTAPVKLNLIAMVEMIAMGREFWMIIFLVPLREGNYPSLYIESSGCISVYALHIHLRLRFYDFHHVFSFIVSTHPTFPLWVCQFHLGINHCPSLIIWVLVNQTTARCRSMSKMVIDIVEMVVNITGNGRQIYSCWWSNLSC